MSKIIYQRYNFVKFEDGFFDTVGGHIYGFYDESYFGIPKAGNFLYIENFKSGSYTTTLVQRSIERSINLNELSLFSNEIFIDEAVNFFNSICLEINGLILVTPHQINLNNVNHHFDQIMISDRRGINLVKIEKCFPKLIFNFTERFFFKILQSVDDNSAREIIFSEDEVILRTCPRNNRCKCDNEWCARYIFNYLGLKNFRFVKDIYNNSQKRNKECERVLEKFVDKIEREEFEKFEELKSQDLFDNIMF